MKKRLVIFMTALLMLFGGITTAKAEGEIDTALNIFNGLSQLYNDVQNSENSDEAINIMKENVTQYIVSNPGVVKGVIGDNYKYIYVGVTEEEKNILMGVVLLPVVAGYNAEGRGNMNAVKYIIFNSGSAFESLRQRISEAELRDAVIDDNGQPVYNIPTEDDGYPYHIILPIKVNTSNAVSEDTITEDSVIDGDNLVVEISDFIIKPVNDSQGTTKTNNSKINSKTTTAASKKTVKNPKTGDVLFTILGTITLAGAGFVVTLKKAKQR